MRLKVSCRSRIHRQVLVEFALALPLQLFLVFGIIQLALLGVSTLMVNYTAYRCARSALVGEHKEVLGRYVLNSTGDELDEHRGIDLVAQLLLAPLSVDSLPDGQGRPPALSIPGRGLVPNSDVAGVKTRVVVMDPTDPDNAYYDPSHSGPDWVTVVVEFNQEIYFPVIDRLFRLICRRDEEPADAYALGRRDAEFRGYHQGELNEEDSGLGRIREIAGRTHYVITRRCTLYKNQAERVVE